MTAFGSTALAIAMIAAGMAMRKADRQRGLLMLAAAIVLFANVLIWTV